MKKERAIFLVYFWTLIGIMLWMGAIFWAPYLKSRSSSLHIFLYGLFSLVCHQIPVRSFLFAGQPLAVCGRCMGIYSGFLLGTLAYPFIRGFRNFALPVTRLFILLSFPIVADTAGNFLKLWSTSNTLRLITGLIWGTILPFYFIAGLTDAFSRRST